MRHVVEDVMWREYLFMNMNKLKGKVNNKVTRLKINQLMKHLSINKISEEELINELVLSREISEKTTRDFEKELLAFSLNVDKDLVVDRHFMHAAEYTLSFNDRTSSKCLCIMLEELGDVFGNPYLLIKRKLSDMDIDDIYDLLKLQIELCVGGDTISRSSVATHIFISKLCGKEICETDDYTKIPLALFHTSDGDFFSIISARYHSRFVIINGMNPETLEEKFGTLSLSFIVYDYVSHQRDKIYEGQSISGNYITNIDDAKQKREAAKLLKAEYMFLTSGDIILNNDEPFYIDISGMTKFIIFRLVPKTEQIHLQPLITDVIITTNNNNEIMFSNVMSMDILSIAHDNLFGSIKLFVISLTHETTAWKNFKDVVKKCDFKECFYYLQKIRVSIVTDIPCENYDVIMSPVRTNFLRCCSGMMGKKDC